MDQTTVTRHSPTSSDRGCNLVRRTWNDYLIGTVLGEGASGIVYRLIPDTHPTDPDLVVKVARGEPENDENIIHEWTIGSRLCEDLRGDKLPIVFYAAKTTFSGRDCIFMQQGKLNAYSYLSTVRTQSSQKVLLGKIGEVASQLIRRLEQFHDLGYIHCDVKLTNFVEVFDQSRQEYVFKIADLGLANRYLDETGQHLPNGPSPFVGTPSFSSKNTDRGNAQSRRDDMESLAYSLIDLALPSALPWHGKSFNELRKMKAQIPPEDLCTGLPPTFAKFLIYCDELDFEERPDYCKWKAEFASIGESPERGARLLPDNFSGRCPREAQRTNPSNSSANGGEKTDSVRPPRSAGKAILYPIPLRSKSKGPDNTASLERWNKKNNARGRGQLKRTAEHTCRAVQPASLGVKTMQGNFSSATAAVPHFARPTIAYLARQKPFLHSTREYTDHEAVARKACTRLSSSG